MPSDETMIILGMAIADAGQEFEALSREDMHLALDQLTDKALESNLACSFLLSIAILFAQVFGTRFSVGKMMTHMSPAAGTGTTWLSCHI